jgi:outer membrane protein OmpA-like peptidoglycan-associated protein
MYGKIELRKSGELEMRRYRGIMDRHIIGAAAFLCWVFAAAPSYPEGARPWHEPFFVEGAALHYAAPEMFSEMIQPATGFRAALGYEFRRFRFAAESGYTIIRGTNPFVRELRFCPLSFKLGYSLPIYGGLGLQADLSAGALFSQTAHYQDAIGLILEKEMETPASSPVAGARLYATWTVPRSSVKIYSGGGADAVFEIGGAIPLPAFEAGISLKPFALFRPKARGRGIMETKAHEKEVPEPGHPLSETEARAEAHQKTVVARAAVYFRADSAAVIEEHRPALDEAGQLLRSDPALRVTLRGYAAPFGTEEGQAALSAARSWHCAEYLMRHYGVAEGRMNIEFYGADETPAQDAWEYRRRVDLIIEQIVTNEK